MEFSDFKTLVAANRSCRRFDSTHPVTATDLRELIGLTRLTASAGNHQPLKYILSASADTNRIIFDTLAWAAYLTDWPGPIPEERPAAYILITGDHHISDRFWCDHGIAAQTLLLGARAMGLAGCMFGAFHAGKLATALEIPDHLEIKLVVALGKPLETACIDPVGPSGDIRYFRDENQVHHVPKRPVDDLIFRVF
jgi:nitroreductase